MLHNFFLKGLAHILFDLVHGISFGGLLFVTFRKLIEYLVISIVISSICGNTINVNIFNLALLYIYIYHNLKINRNISMMHRILTLQKSKLKIQNTHLF